MIGEEQDEMNRDVAVRLDCDGAVATMTLNRPAKLNPLDRATITALRDMVTDLEARPEIRVIRLTGAGKAFSAGGDLAGYISLASKLQSVIVEVTLQTQRQIAQPVALAFQGRCHHAGGKLLPVAVEADRQAGKVYVYATHLNVPGLPCHPDLFTA